MRIIKYPSSMDSKFAVCSLKIISRTLTPIQINLWNRIADSKQKTLSSISQSKISLSSPKVTKHDICSGYMPRISRMETVIRELCSSSNAYLALILIQRASR